MKKKGQKMQVEISEAQYEITRLQGRCTAVELEQNEAPE